MGRIRVELASGYIDGKHGRFVKTQSIVNFAFQPAPMGKSNAVHPLCLCGIRHM